MVVKMVHTVARCGDNPQSSSSDLDTSVSCSIASQVRRTRHCCACGPACNSFASSFNALYFKMDCLKNDSFFYLFNKTMATTRLPIVIFIEGTIGAGKSSFLDNIKQWSSFRDQFHIITEPVDEWMNIGKHETGKSIFQMYYENPDRYAFPFQWAIFQSYVRNLLASIQQHHDIPILIVERSVWSIRNVFIESMLRRGILEPIHRVIFDTWFPFLIDEVYKDLGKLNRFIYLSSDVPLCQERIRIRARPGEDAINDDLMLSLHECHEDWLRPERDDLHMLRINHSVNFKTHPDQYITDVIQPFDNYLQHFLTSIPS